MTNRVLSRAVEGAVVLVRGRSEVEGGQDSVGREPSFVDQLSVFAVVEEPAESHGCGVRIDLKLEQFF